MAAKHTDIKVPGSRPRSNIARPLTLNTMRTSSPAVIAAAPTSGSSKYMSLMTRR